jgi:hypothetical protein
VSGPRLIEAVRSVAAGDGVLEPRVTRRLLSTFAESAPPPARPAGLDLRSRVQAAILAQDAGLISGPGRNV